MKKFLSHLIKRVLESSPMWRWWGWGEVQEGGFSHANKQLSDTNSICKNLTQFNSILILSSSESITSHQLRVQSYKPASNAHFRCQSQAHVATCNSDCLAINQKFPPSILPWVQLLFCNGSQNTEHLFTNQITSVLYK